MTLLRSRGLARLLPYRGRRGVDEEGQEGSGSSSRRGVGRARSQAHRAVPTMACCRRRRAGMRPGELGDRGAGPLTASASYLSR